MTSGGAFSLPIAEVGELDAALYVGLIDEAAIACLSVRLATEGLLTPIWVRRNGNAAETRWSVIAGRHRLRAAQRLGWTEIAAVQHADASSGPDELRALQVAENLDRRVLRPIERACNIMERWRAAAKEMLPSEAHNQQSRASRARWHAVATVANADAADEATASACGLSVRSVQRYRQLHEALVVPFPDLFAPLNAHPLGESLAAMTRIAQLKQPEARQKAIETILSRPDWQSMDEVMVAAGLAMSTGNRVNPEKLGAVMMDAWAKLPPLGRKAHVEWLAEKVTPGQALNMVARFKERGLL